ncbi:MAG: hypothetical protein LQ349_000735 [Xanthoria aureola]|nr:MAG: hypothetical protein LQ349_000735 [Xanthoria aureola]
MSPQTPKAIGEQCNKLFLKILYSLPKSGTVANPINLDNSLAPATTVQPSRDPSTMASEGKSASWSGDEEKLLFLQILSEQNIKIDYAAVATKVGRSASAVKQHLNKMKNEAKKATSNFASTADNASSAADDTPKAPKRRATPKQKAAMEAATSMANKGETAAGYGSSDGNRTEEATPIQAAPAKKSRGPAKSKDGEPAAKKQKTAGIAKETAGAKTDGKATTPTAFTDQLLTAASPVGTGSSIKMEEGSDGEADAEKKRKHGMMDGNNMDEKAEDEGGAREGQGST